MVFKWLPRSIDDGVDHDHGVVPVHERGHDHGVVPDRGHVDDHGSKTISTGGTFDLAFTLQVGSRPDPAIRFSTDHLLAVGCPKTIPSRWFSNRVVAAWRRSR
jgi:hypothetical protein